MAVRLTKAWRPCTDDALAAVPGHLGVFELANADGDTVYIGCADAKSLFGLHSAIEAKVSELSAASFRMEITSAYHTRWRELLMAHVADHGALPPRNEVVPGLGRLSPA